jgi:hypothetical protein
MESSRDHDKLAEALRALRPAPSIAFAAELDARVAAGFPRPAPSGEAPLARFGARLRAMKPRQLLLPAAATALTLIVVVTIVVANYHASHLNIDTSPGGATTQARPTGAAASPERRANEGELLGKITRGYASAGNAVETPALPSSSSAEAEAPAPGIVESIPRDQSQGFNASVNHRDIEHSAQMTLGADPEDVGDAAGKVFEAVHAAHGIVLRSSVQNGSAGHAGAQFDLLIPSGRLDDALAAFSGIAEVRSRNDGTVDITAPTVGVGERLQDSQAKIDGLLSELAGSETETEREAIEAQLTSERRRSARLGAQLESLKKRAGLSHVSLKIVTGGSSTSSGGGWDAGDAIGDASHILAVAAGVTIVGLAILGPIALLALLLWLAYRAWLRRGRERALG